MNRNPTNPPPDETTTTKQFNGGRRPWTTRELTVLRTNATRGAEAIAGLLGRTAASVRLQAHRHRISLRRTPAGRTLGDPTDPQLRHLIRTNPTTATAIAQAAKASPTRPLCPACTIRPQHSTAYGLCLPCHHRALADAHRDAADAAEARRDLAQARQAKHRAITGDHS